MWRAASRERLGAMCIFSGRASLAVSGTQIFARREGGSQSLIYSMKLTAGDDVAMVLPLPTAMGAREDALEFVDLSGYPTLFGDLAYLFQREEMALLRLAPQPKSRSNLAVHDVGAFAASFVPSVRDFVRLDPRFRLSDAVWSALPQYTDWSFAVFQLKKGEHRVHPMALRFPTRDAQLFFPTVHVHDGEVHERADFDHELYWQGAPSAPCEVTEQPFYDFQVPRTQGTLVAERLVRRVLKGSLANQDTWIG